MLYIIDIHWSRRTPETGRPDSGTTTYAEYTKTLNAAKRRAAANFRRHYGMHLNITATREKAPSALSSH